VRFPDFNRDYDSIFRMDIEDETPDIYPFGYDELYEDAERTAEEVP
jgi:hypothetical protein